MEDFQNDPAWIPSLGEKLGKIHFRSGHYHAECDPNTGFCEIHYDEDDPYESVPSLINHMSVSKLGKVVLVVGIAAILDQIFTGGQVRNALLKEFSI